MRRVVTRPGSGATSSLSGRLRRFGLVPLACAGLALTACGAPQHPAVSFFSAGHTVTTGPAQYCDPQVDRCTADPTADAVLRVPPGQPLQISVPSDVGDAAWQVAFRYRTRTGEEVEARSSVFPPGAQLAYTLRTPAATDQLETAEIQKFGGVAQDPSGSLVYLIGATWVLSVDDRH